MGLLRLTRPANIITAIADILAGVAISGFLRGDYDYTPVLWLILSTIGLYGGGVVFNDVFDAKLDAVERPERPIPSGLITIAQASALGTILLIIGVASAFRVSLVAGALASAIAFFALLYDKWGKHQDLLGPVNMGLCRGLNLLLGVSLVQSQLDLYWFIAILPIMYIGAITMISRGEVHGGSRKTLYSAAFFYAIVIINIATGAVLRQEYYAIVFLISFGVIIFPPLFRAIRTPKGPLIGKAVKAGVLALILMDASWAAAFGEIALACGILLLLPLSIGLARLFAVT
jgi:hypothetical protein